MTTLVTGALGCLGAWVTRRLLATGERPILLDVADDPWRLEMVVGSEKLSGLTMLRGTIADRDRLLGIVREHGVDRIIHLAAWQIPLCRQDPAGGALVNVYGTTNVFEAARLSEGRVRRVVYFSSAAVFGPPERYGPQPVQDEAPLLPETIYGVYKVANEDTARIYWQDHRIPSMGFRPLSVYGVGRDFGVTADPTLAMKSAVLGRPFRIRWGGSSDLIFADDVAAAAERAWASSLTGARVYNLHGETVSMPDLIRIIEEAVPAARGTLTCADSPIPVPTGLVDARYQRELGPAERTGIRDGVRRTIEEFGRLKAAGRLDARELEAGAS